MPRAPGELIADPVVRQSLQLLPDLRVALAECRPGPPERPVVAGYGHAEPSHRRTPPALDRIRLDRVGPARRVQAGGLARDRRPPLGGTAGVPLRDHPGGCRPQWDVQPQIRQDIDGQSDDRCCGGHREPLPGQHHAVGVRPDRLDPVDQPDDAAQLPRDGARDAVGTAADPGEAAPERRAGITETSDLMQEADHGVVVLAGTHQRERLGEQHLMRVRPQTEPLDVLGHRHVQVLDGAVPVGTAEVDACGIGIKPGEQALVLGQRSRARKDLFLSLFGGGEHQLETVAPRLPHDRVVKGGRHPLRAEIHRGSGRLELCRPDTAADPVPRLQQHDIDPRLGEVAGGNQTTRHPLGSFRIPLLGALPARPDRGSSPASHQYV